MPYMGTVEPRTFVQAVFLALKLGFRVLDDVPVVLAGDQVEQQAALAVVLLGSGHDDLLLRKPDAAELDRQPLQPARVAAARIDRGSGHLGHAPEPVEDVAWKADRFRELRIQVDRIEVARRTGVAE